MLSFALGGYKDWQAPSFYVPSESQTDGCQVYLNSKSPGGMAWTFYAWLWKLAEGYWLCTWQNYLQILEIFITVFPAVF